MISQYKLNLYLICFYGVEIIEQIVKEKDIDSKEEYELRTVIEL